MTTQSPSHIDHRLERQFSALHEVTSHKCHGRTLVIGHGNDGLVHAIRDTGLDVTVFDAAALHGDTSSSSSEGQFKTVVVPLLVHTLSEEGRAEAMDRAWSLVEAGGRLIVSVPNEDALPREERDGQLNRRKLRKLLRPFGEPQLVMEQPYTWLMMYVTKKREAVRLPNRSNRKRFGITAKYCRGRVIELGCGEGHLSKAIADRGHEVVGFDINKPKIRRARKLYPEVTFYQKDVSELDVMESSFDTVVLAEILEHVPDNVGEVILAKACKVVRPGGRIVVSVPNEDCIPHPNHIRRFTRHSLKKMLEPLGRTKVVTEQPYKWLMMYVDIPS